MAKRFYDHCMMPGSCFLSFVPYIFFSISLAFVYLHLLIKAEESHQPKERIFT